jgi:hypothetical protein
MARNIVYASPPKQTKRKKLPSPPIESRIAQPKRRAPKLPDPEEVERATAFLLSVLKPPPDFEAADDPGPLVMSLRARSDSLSQNAADEIERLRARLKELEG